MSKEPYKLTQDEYYKWIRRVTGMNSDEWKSDDNIISEQIIQALRFKELVQKEWNTITDNGRLTNFLHDSTLISFVRIIPRLLEESKEPKK